MTARWARALAGALVLLGAGLLATCDAGDSRDQAPAATSRLLLTLDPPTAQLPQLNVALDPTTAYPEIQQTTFEKKVYVETLLEWAQPPGPCPPELEAHVALDVEGPGLVDKGGLPTVVTLREARRLVFAPTLQFDCTAGPCLTALVVKALWAGGADYGPLSMTLEAR